MAIVVVGGSGRGVGKTALVCGLIAALPEFQWAAVKIASHEHGQGEAIWEESDSAPDVGQGTDTARYLAAGAQRAFLVTPDLHSSSPVTGFPFLLGELWSKLGPGAHVLIESNRILQYLKPDLCLLVDGGPAGRKASFTFAFGHGDALVAHAGADETIGGGEQSKPIFHLATLERISAQMTAWVRERLGAEPGAA